MNRVFHWQVVACGGGGSVLQPLLWICGDRGFSHVLFMATEMGFVCGLAFCRSSWNLFRLFIYIYFVVVVLCVVFDGVASTAGQTRVEGRRPGREDKREWESGRERVGRRFIGWQNLHAHTCSCGFLNFWISFISFRNFHQFGNFIFPNENQRRFSFFFLELVAQ